MYAYKVEYNNCGFGNGYVRNYSTESLYDAVRWFDGVKCAYKHVRLINGYGDILIEHHELP